MSNKNRQSTHQNDSPWDACPAGELTQMVHRLDASQRRTRSLQVGKTALLSTAVFACVVMVLGSFMGSSSLQFGGIDCETCQSRLAEYYPHAAGELVHEDVDFVASIETHLKECEFCREKFYAMYPALNTTRTTTLRLRLAFAQLSISPVSADRFW